MFKLFCYFIVFMLQQGIIIKCDSRANIALLSTGTTCIASTEFSSDFLCDRAIDGRIERAPEDTGPCMSEWAERGPNNSEAWLKLFFSTVSIISRVKVMQRPTSSVSVDKMFLEFDAGEKITMNLSIRNGSDCRGPTGLWWDELDVNYLQSGTLFVRLPSKPVSGPHHGIVEIEVYGLPNEDGLTNIALVSNNATCTASTVFDAGFVCENAIDGLVYAKSGSCYMEWVKGASTNAVDSWIAIQFQDIYRIYKIRIMQRTYHLEIIKEMLLGFDNDEVLMQLSARNGSSPCDPRALWWDELDLRYYDILSQSLRAEVHSVYTDYNVGIIELEVLGVSPSVDLRRMYQTSDESMNHAVRGNEVIITTLSEVTAQICSANCVLTVDCKGFNYNDDVQQCELLNTNSNRHPTLLEEQAGYRHYWLQG